MKRILIALAIVAASAAALSTPARAAGPAQCGDVLFVGAAGSGESGMGAEVTAVYSALKANAKGRTVTAYALPYRAAPVLPTMIYPGVGAFMESLIGGEGTLNTFLFDRARQCPGERLVLAGFSQGAMVIHRSMQILGSLVTDRIDGIVLIGDGDRLPGDDGQMLGSAGSRAKGVGQWYPQFSLANGQKLGAIGGRVFSLCNALDIVCDHQPALYNPASTLGRVMIGIGTAVHLSYRLGPQLADLGAKAAAKLRKDALVAYRPSGRAGFVSYVTGFTCPVVSSGYVLVVTRGAGQGPSEGFTDPYNGLFSNGARVASAENVAPGTYPATVSCEASTDPNVRTGGRSLATYTFTQTVTTTKPLLGVNPAAARPGQTLTVTDGGGCGAYPTPAQSVSVAVHDAIRGGKPIVEVNAPVNPAGRWDAVRLTLPAEYGVGGWHVSASCGAASGDGPDQSYQPYPSVTVAAG
ncbi:cutinase family protein [Dactylosporangium vinaceum]|uniref:Cutinase family protein n=1 Tax=Dactylosporangium vinaceum TaxID=53362 RepID=A0ABV5MMF7_9ACTN|nr:cutinase family protein [Dactylosporangium vinaceum]UAB93257.1 cutinase family protein [Dactylosporangium vinaceum]